MCDAPPFAGTSEVGLTFAGDPNDSALLPDGSPLLDSPTCGPLLESIRSCCVLSPQGIVQGLAQVCEPLTQGPKGLGLGLGFRLLTWFSPDLALITLKF